MNETKPKPLFEKTRFDLEQSIQECWSVTTDLEDIAAMVLDDPRFEGMDPQHADHIFNLVYGAAKLYEMRFEKCFGIFEKLVTEGKIK